MMQSGDSASHHYGHPGVPMDLHMPQPFSYYSCIMDNNAMFAAQQNAVYGKMYGSLDASGRRADELGAQSTINTRILELRKEKSRDAARSRRGKENHEYYELAKMLPLPGAITSQLDKASIIRLTIAYLRLRDFAAQGDPVWSKETSQQQRLKTANAFRSNASTMAAMEMFEEHEGTHILQSLDGFAISLNSDGRFLYISETVSIYLGLSQVELTGSSVFDYVHQSDHLELAEQLGVNLAHQQRLSSSGSSHHSSPLHGAGAGTGSNNLGETILSGQHTGSGISTGGQSPAIPDVCYPVTTLMHARVDRQSGKPTYDRSFCIRMKSTLTKRGCHFKSSGYRVVLLLGKLRPAGNSRSGCSVSKNKSNSSNNSQRQSSSSSSSNQHHSSTGLAASSGTSGSSSVMGFIGVAIALPPPSVHEVRLESDMFVTRLSFDFKIAHCEPKVSELLDYTADDLTGQSLYALCHGEDVHKMKKTHEDLLNKGQVMSNYYRIMNKNGGYSWMQSCATLICNTKKFGRAKHHMCQLCFEWPQFANIIMDQCQMPGTGKLTGGIRIKEDPHDYAEAGDKCDMHDKKGNLKRQYQTLNEASDGRNNHSSDTSTDITGHVPGTNDGNVPGSAFHIGPNEDMGQVRLGQQGNYHVTNTTNKDWPFWRPPTLI